MKPQGISPEVPAIFAEPTTVWVVTYAATHGFMKLEVLKDSVLNAVYLDCLFCDYFKGPLTGGLLRCFTCTLAEDGRVVLADDSRDEFRLICGSIRVGGPPPRIQIDP